MIRYTVFRSREQPRPEGDARLAAESYFRPHGEHLPFPSLGFHGRSRAVEQRLTYQSPAAVECLLTGEPGDRRFSGALTMAILWWQPSDVMPISESFIRSQILPWGWRYGAHFGRQARNTQYILREPCYRNRFRAVYQ